MTDKVKQIFLTQQNVCTHNHNFIRNFLQKKGMKEEFIAEIFKVGLTDRTTKKLECKGFTYDEIMMIAKAFSGEMERKDYCNCTFDGATEFSVRTANRDSDYLKDKFGEILPEALREIVIRKPYDPVEYLGHWLLHFVECLEREKRLKEFEAELLEERLKYVQEIVIPPEPQDFEEEEEEYHEGDEESNGER